MAGSNIPSSRSRMVNPDGTPTPVWFQFLQLVYRALGAGANFTVDNVMLKTNNLSDVASAATARGNLGSGTTGDALFTAATPAAARSTIGVRDTLAADRTYYVRTDGNDNNDGLTNSSGGAKLTIQAALDAVAQIDFNGYVVTVQIASGTYTEDVVVPATVGQADETKLVIRGDTTTPSNVVLNGYLSVYAGAFCSFEGVKLTTGGLYASSGGYLNVSGKIEFGACGNYHMSALANGVINFTGSNYTISGNAPYHCYCYAGGKLIQGAGGTVTLTGTPAFSGSFLLMDELSLAEIYTVTYSGSATGKRYEATLNSVINTYGGGATYLPGNAAGSTATGGQYA